MFQNCLFVTRELSLVEKLDLMKKIDEAGRYDHIDNVLNSETGEVVIRRDTDLGVWIIC